MTAALPTLVSITFDQERHDRPGAIRTRRNREYRRPTEDWHRDRDLRVEPSEVVYARRLLDGALVGLKATIAWDAGTAQANKYRVRAVPPVGQPDHPFGPTGELNLSPDPKGVNLDFRVDAGNAPASRLPIGGYPFSYEWQVAQVSDSIVIEPVNEEAWQTFGTTHHTLYLLLDHPSSPWAKPTPERPLTHSDDLDLPWIGIIRQATEWARGADTKEEAVRMVASGFAGLGGSRIVVGGLPARLHYDPIRYYATGSDNELFRCESLINLLSGAPDRGPSMNCADVASAVVLCANVLGCSLASLPLYPADDAPDGVFYTNTVLRWGATEVGESVWPYHEIVVDSADAVDNGDAVRVFDVCLRLSGGDAEEGSPSRFEAAFDLPLRTKDPNQPGYLERLFGVAVAPTVKAGPTFLRAIIPAAPSAALASAVMAEPELTARMMGAPIDS